MRSFCANCGAPVEEGAAFCGSCGAPVQNAVEPMQPAVPVEPPVAPVESQPSAPVESAAPAQAPVYPVYQQPVYVQPVSPLKGSNGVGVASFVMSMVSLVATIAVIAIISSIMDSVSSFYFSFSELQTLCTSGIVLAILALLGFYLERKNVMDQSLRLLFTEMLRRTGRCRALYDGPEGMLLQTGGNGLFCGIPDADALLRVLRGVTVPKDAGFTVFSHEAADAVQREFGLHAQEAYETLLYLQPSPPEVPACSIRPLKAEDAAEAARYYHLFDDPLPYLRGRAEAGALWGHFTAEGRLAGFLGIHSEGSMGMLEVVPEFRRHGIAQALEAALIRLHLERGWLPYCFVAPDNVPSLSLQAKLGLTNIHIPAIWLF